MGETELTKLTRMVARDKAEGFTWQRYSVCDIAALLERLEQCEAALAMYRAAHDAKFGPSLKGGCRCTACDAARAAVEEK